MPPLSRMGIPFAAFHLATLQYLTFYPKRSVNHYISWMVAAYITLSPSFQGSESKTYLCSSRSFLYSSWQVLLWLFTPALKYSVSCHEYAFLAYSDSKLAQFWQPASAPWHRHLLTCSPMPWARPFAALPLTILHPLTLTTPSTSVAPLLWLNTHSGYWSFLSHSLGEGQPICATELFVSKMRAEFLINLRISAVLVELLNKES